ncbi:Retrotransposon gag protein [Arachis hypogaea]|nr:Retrotransposon gag protein [Arachis hypogaea]
MFTEWDKLQNFYEGLTLKAQESLDHSAGGSLQLMKIAEEAQNLIDMVANNQYFFAHQRNRQPSQRRGVMELEGVDSILAQNKMMQQQIQQQFEQMAKRIDSLQVAAVNTSQPSSTWEQNEETQEEQQQEQVQYMHNQGPNEVYGDTYNPSWKNHPNLRWGDNHTQNQQPWQRNSNQNNPRSNQNHNQQQTNQNPHRKPQNNYPNPNQYQSNNQPTNQNAYHPPPASHNPPQVSPESQRLTNLETLIDKMLKYQEMTTKNHEASIKSLERQIGQISKQISVERPSSSLPSDTIPNPKEEYKAIQLRSGRTLMSNNDTTKKQAESSKKSIEDEEQTKEDEAKNQVVMPNKSTEKLKEKDNQSHSSKEVIQGQQQVRKSITPPLPYPQKFNKEAKEL